MENRSAFYEGCLLGLAVGDALGLAVDDKTLAQIREAYGPNGLMGYDLPDEVAQISFHTQSAAFAANGLLLALSRGRVEQAVLYVARALREYNEVRLRRTAPQENLCWLSKCAAFSRRNCTDNRVLDALSRPQLGTVSAPANRTNSPAGIFPAVAVGLFYDKHRMQAWQIGQLSAESTALLCGASEAFLTSAALGYLIAALLQAPEQPLQAHCMQAALIIKKQFGSRFACAEAVAQTLENAVRLSRQKQDARANALEEMDCETAQGCLAAAVYTCLVYPNNFDEAMVSAVNHSGRSAAVASITGAILGAKLGAQEIPDFYLAALESAPQLRCLARDLQQGTPAKGLFDDAYEQKYAHGIPPNM